MAYGHVAKYGHIWLFMAMVYKFENLRAALYWHSKTALQRTRPKSKILFFWHRLLCNNCNVYFCMCWCVCVCVKFLSILQTKCAHAEKTTCGGKHRLYAKYLKHWTKIVMPNFEVITYFQCKCRRVGDVQTKYAHVEKSSPSGGRTPNILRHNFEAGLGWNYLWCENTDWYSARCR